MNQVLILALKALKAMFGQNALWDAVRAVVEVRGKIKLAKFELEKDEGEQLRQIKYDIKEEKAKAKLERKKKRGERNK